MKTCPKCGANARGGSGCYFECGTVVWCDGYISEGTQCLRDQLAQANARLEEFIPFLSAASTLRGYCDALTPDNLSGLGRYFERFDEAASKLQQKQGTDATNDTNTAN